MGDDEFFNEALQRFHTPVQAADIPGEQTGSSSVSVRTQLLANSCRLQPVDKDELLHSQLLRGLHSVWNDGVHHQTGCRAERREYHQTVGHDSEGSGFPLQPVRWQDVCKGPLLAENAPPKAVELLPLGSTPTAVELKGAAVSPLRYPPQFLP
jgi:hypothetical protein